MTRAASLHVSPEMRAGIATGRVRSFAALAGALQSAGWLIDWRLPGDEPLPHHITDNAAPSGPLGLTLRRAYAPPFFRLERTNDRWNWQVATKHFPAENFGPNMGGGLQKTLRRQLIGPEPPGQGGYIFVPLQGHLTAHRSFQSMSPLLMLETLLAHDPRPVRATLHPRETYAAPDLAALHALCARFPRLTLETGSLALLRDCDLVVTQNSGMAFTGYTANKPALLFAQIDFHHIAASVPRDGLQAALEQRHAPPPRFAAYLHWFLRLNAIDASAADATDQFRRRLQDHGWPMA